MSPDYWWFALPLLMFIGCLVMWYRSGRDPWRGRAVKTEYEPPEGLGPGEMGALVDEKVDLRDIVGTIVDLAGRGHLRIERFMEHTLRGTDYLVTLTKLWRGDPGIKPFESVLLGALFLPERPALWVIGPFRVTKASWGHFEVDLAQPTEDEATVNRQRYLSEILRDKEIVRAIGNQVYRDLVERGYFFASPRVVRRVWRFIGLGVVILFWYLAAGNVISIAGWLGGVVSGLILIAFAPVMPRKRIQGSTANYHILGFREFLARVEKDHLARLDSDTLHRWLPYAIALGVEESWMAGFRSLRQPAPPEVRDLWEDLAGFIRNIRGEGVRDRRVW